MIQFTRPNRVLANGRQAVMASDHNNLARCVEELQNAWRPEKPGMGGKGKSPENSTIVPVSYRKDGDTWKVKFNSAKLFEFSLVNAGTGHEIKLGASNLTAEEPPELSLSAGENEVWISWEIETDGTVIAGTPEVFTGEPPTTIPMEPLRPEGADTPGLLAQQLGIITLEEGSGPVWMAIAPHVSSQCYAAGILNLGDGLSLWSDYDAIGAIDNWRTIKQLDAPGVAIIDSESETLGETIDFRRVKERSDSTPQVHVVEDDGAVLIKGNDVDANIEGPGGLSLTIRDGLFTGGSSATLGGFTGEVHWQFNFTPDEGDAVSWLFKQVFDQGLLQTVQYNVADPTNEGIHLLDFSTVDTDT